MIYFMYGIVFLTSIYSFSFAKFSWKQKNRKAAVGVVLLILISFVMPFLIYIKNR